MDVTYCTTEQPTVIETPTTVDTQTASNAASLSDVVKREVSRLLADINDDTNANLYGKIISQMDDGIIEALIEHTNNNQSMATRILGLARGTVRKKWAAFVKAKQEESKF